MSLQYRSWQEQLRQYPWRVSSGPLRSEANQRPTVARWLTAFDVFVQIWHNATYRYSLETTHTHLHTHTGNYNWCSCWLLNKLQIVFLISWWIMYIFVLSDQQSEIFWLRYSKYLASLLDTLCLLLCLSFKLLLIYVYIHMSVKVQTEMIKKRNKINRSTYKSGRNMRLKRLIIMVEEMESQASHMWKFPPSPLFSTTTWGDRLLNSCSVNFGSTVTSVL